MLTNERLEVFNDEEFGKIRTLLIDEKPYFCASDVAKALGYSNPNKAVNDHCRAIVKRPIKISGKMQDINFIPEEDIALLISRNRKLSSIQKNKIIEELKNNGVISKSYIPVISRKEIEFGEKIEKILEIAFNKVKDYVDENNANIITELIRQYPVLNYKIDFYLPFFHIGIEYDEKEHKYKTEDDDKRQKDIEQYFDNNNSYINFIRVKEGNENQFIGEFIGNLMTFSL